MPAWLKEPAQSSGGWQRTAALWTGSLAALALVFAGSMWLFEEHKADSAMGVVAMNSGAAVSPAPVVQDDMAGPQAVPVERAKVSKLPPLVLLEPAPPKPASGADDTENLAAQPGATSADVAPAPVPGAKPAEPVRPPAANMAPPAPAVAAKEVPKSIAGFTELPPKSAVLPPNKSVQPPVANAPAIKAAPAVAARSTKPPAPVAKAADKAEPVIAKAPPRAPAPAQVAKAAAVKPRAVKSAPQTPTLAKAPAAAQRKPLVARNLQQKPKTKAALASKKPVPGKRPVTSLAKAKPRPVAAVTLPPARQYREEPEAAPTPTPRRPPLPGRCQPGELARECAARLGVR